VEKAIVTVKEVAAQMGKDPSAVLRLIKKRPRITLGWRVSRPSGQDVRVISKSDAEMLVAEMTPGLHERP
jgi:hypothetical protein